MLLDKDIVLHLVHHLNTSRDLEVTQQVIWSLANLAGEGKVVRDQILNNGAIQKMIEMLSENLASVSFLQTCTWAIFCLCRGDPIPDFNLVKVVVAALTRLIATEPAPLCDNETLSNITWTIQQLSLENQQNLADFMNQDLIKKLIEFLDHDNISVVVAS